MYAGAVTLPADVVTVRWSPFSTPSRFAVIGCTSTQLCHESFVTGSDSSCSHGLFAPSPAPNTGDG